MPGFHIEWHNPINNRHAMQGILNKHYSVDLEVPYERCLLPGAPTRVYKRGPSEVKTVCHWGQRKLLLSEIEFLTLFEHSLVVYAGAAPGDHIKLLTQLFPGTKFVLVDPAPFSCRSSDRVEIRQTMFTDAIASEFADLPGTLFVSDVRTGDPETMSEDEVEVAIARDMEDQQRWHRLMRPEASMMKLRFPWRPGSTLYLDGEIRLPIWGPVRTTECRLIALRDAGNRVYDNETYEQQLFYFCTHTRVALYPHPVDGGHLAGQPELCHCYDCVAEMHVLLAHQERFPETWERLGTTDLAEMSRLLSPWCADKRTLMDPNSDPKKRNAGIRRRQHVLVNGKKVAACRANTTAARRGR